MCKFRPVKKSSSGVKLSTKASGFSAFKNHRKGKRTPRKNKIIKVVPIQSKHWEFIVTPENWFLGKVNVKPSDLVADTLRSRLTDEQKRIFKSSCFGCFLDMHEIAVNPQLLTDSMVHEMIM